MYSCLSVTVTVAVAVTFNSTPRALKEYLLYIYDLFYYDFFLSTYKIIISEVQYILPYIKINLLSLSLPLPLFLSSLSPQIWLNEKKKKTINE